MKKVLLSLAVLFVLALPSAARADVFTFTPPDADVGDLDHSRVYAWRIDNVNFGGQSITGARLTFQNISVDSLDPNRLFIHLLDTVKSAGLSSFIDEPVMGSIIDDFVNTRYHNQSNWLVANGTADTFLTSATFVTVPTNFIYDFSASELQAFSAYITNSNNFALGFDPDGTGNFLNDGITLEITTNESIPEPTTMLLLGTGLAGLYYRHRKQKAESNS